MLSRFSPLSSALRFQSRAAPAAGVSPLLARVHSPVCGCPCCGATKRAMLGAVRHFSSVERGPTGRPISPHVQIYKFPLAAYASVSTRFTGMGLAFGAWGVGLVTLFGCNIAPAVAAFSQSSPVLASAAKLIVVFPFVYHTAAGFRHLYWDRTTKGLSLSELDKSSQFLIGGSVLASLLLAAITLTPSEDKKKKDKKEAEVAAVEAKEAEEEEEEEEPAPKKNAKKEKKAKAKAEKKKKKQEKREKKEKARKAKQQAAAAQKEEERDVEDQTEQELLAFRPVVKGKKI